MRVIATAGHVNHGKSTLVRALTGMEPDRWAEEHRRGMTIDLGYAWMALPGGEELAFVDVPGHQRFIANMLAGLGPVPGLLFVVAADEGWSRQSDEHLAVADALGISHGVLAVTRSDLADPVAAVADSRARLARSSVGAVEAVAVSGRTGAGLPELRQALQRLVPRLPAPDPHHPVRLWVDRAFTVRGSGTVVTATLEAGSISASDEVQLRGRRVAVRAIQSLGQPRERVAGPARVALNLRGVARDAVARGDVLLTPDAWHLTATVDVRLTTARELPSELMLHVGTVAVPARLRPLDPGGSQALVRLRLPRPLPLRAGDRAVLRSPGRQAVAAGVQVLDADPPDLHRRGAAVERAADLLTNTGRVDADREVARRGAMRRDHLLALGGAVPAAMREFDGWLVDDTAWCSWRSAVEPVLAAWTRRTPLDPAMPIAALRRALGVPSDEIAVALAVETSLLVRDGRVRARGAGASLGAAESALRTVEDKLTADPFAAPEAGELAELYLGRRELAAAERAGRLLRIAAEIVLLPSAPLEAVRRLRGLRQPFTTSEARQVLATSRRVAIPLLEYLDANGDTERIDAATRRVPPRR